MVLVPRIPIHGVTWSVVQARIRLLETIGAVVVRRCPVVDVDVMVVAIGAMVMIVVDGRLVRVERVMGRIVDLVGPWGRRGSEETVEWREHRMEMGMENGIRWVA